MLAIVYSNIHTRSSRSREVGQVERPGVTWLSGVEASFPHEAAPNRVWQGTCFSRLGTRRQCPAYPARPACDQSMNRPIASFLISWMALAPFVSGCGLIPESAHGCDAEKRSVDAGDSYLGVDPRAIAARLEGAWTCTIVYTESLPAAQATVTITALDQPSMLYACGSVQDMDLPVRLQFDTSDRMLTLTFDGRLQCSPEGEVRDESMDLSFPSGLLSGSPMLPAAWRSTPSDTPELDLEFGAAASGSDGSNLRVTQGWIRLDRVTLAVIDF
jgi:hypothetical protein